MAQILVRVYTCNLINEIEGIKNALFKIFARDV